MLGLRPVCFFLLILAAACSVDTTEPEPACSDGTCAPEGKDASVSRPPDATSRPSVSRPDATVPVQAEDGAIVDEPIPDVEIEPGGDPGKVIGEPDDEASYVFDQTALRTYNIVIEPADLAKLDANPAAEEYVPAMLEVDGKTYGPLAVRYKGSIGAFLYPCTNARQVGDAPGPKVGKCSIKLDFNHVDDEARFYGLKTLNFHSMNQDPSMMRDRLGYALFREMGVAAPRSVHARVTINGALEGLFIAVEQIDGRFTRSRFSEGGKGNLYKEIWPLSDDAGPYKQALETNEEQGDVTRMVAFKRAVDRGTEAVEEWLDRDYLARYLAVDRLIINDDGMLHWYCLPDIGPSAIWNHNYFWYEAPRSRRMWLVPWDLDNSFASNSFVHIEPRWTDKAECTCMGSPAQRAPSCDTLTADFAGWSADYERAVAELVTGPFSAAKVDAKLDAWTKQISVVTQEASGLKGAPSQFIWQLSTAGLRAVINQSRQDHGYSY